MSEYIDERLNFNLWLDYFYQYKLIRGTKCRQILEVGKGFGILEGILKCFGYKVNTADINPNNHPDRICDIRQLPFGSGSYDLVCAFEVLEHIPFEDLELALGEMARVSKKYVAISLPYASIYLSVAIMPPQAKILEKLYNRFGLEFGEPIKINITLPLFFLGKRLMHKEHLWEMGRGRFTTKRIEKTIKNLELKIIKKFQRVLLPYHVFYLLEKTDKSGFADK